MLNARPFPDAGPSRSPLSTQNTSLMSCILKVISVWSSLRKGFRFGVIALLAVNTTMAALELDMAVNRNALHADDYEWVST